MEERDVEFSFTPEHEFFRKTVKEFCRTEVAPHSREMERNGRMPDSIIRGLGALGSVGLAIPRGYGGSEAEAALEFRARQ